MTKQSLSPGDVDAKYRELLKCDPITVAQLDEVPAGEGGVYCFYWTGPAADLVGKSFDAPSPFGKPPTDVLINKGWVGSAHGKLIPLYAGSSTTLRERLKNHRMPETEKVRPSNTTAQVRKVLQKIFRKNGEAQRMFEEHVVVRYVLEKNAITRFYLEHKLIGDLLPLFNVKPEH